MRRILTFGEALIDVIVQPDGKAVLKAGGSMLNSSISLGRCGLDVSFSGVLGDDQQGRFVRNVLREAGVNDKSLHLIPNFQTPIALAFLDENRNANYSFYKENVPENAHLFPELSKGDIFLFGSFYSLRNNLRNDLENYLRYLNNNKSIVIYDPNFRSPHKKELNKVFPAIKSNLKNANIVRASNEDMYQIFGVENSLKSWEIIRDFGVDIFIYTMGEKGGVFFCRDYSFEFSSQATDIVSTIGAGDAFNAGIISAMIEKGLGTSWSRDDADYVVRIAGRFAARVCASFDNYISVEDAKELLG